MPRRDRDQSRPADLRRFACRAAGKEVWETTSAFLDALQPTIVPLTAERARAVGDAYRRWGKGFHKGRLNRGDSFAYALAREYSCPLLYVGNDFPLTDVASALC